jgi:hypothetical protein
MHLTRPHAVLVPVCVMTSPALLQHRLATGMSEENYTSALEMIEDMDAEDTVGPVLGVDMPPALGLGAALGAAADLPPAPQLEEVGARLLATRHLCPCQYFSFCTSQNLYCHTVSNTHSSNPLRHPPAPSLPVFVLLF